MEKTFFRRWFGFAASSTVPESTEAMAHRGVADAQFCLGLGFASGAGKVRDYAQAEHWYRKAAGQNHALAHYNLGMMYAQGQGVACDPAESLLWMQKAAELGDAGGQFSMGMIQHRALLSTRTAPSAEARIDAYKWYRLAADQGYEGAATSCEMVNLRMTRADVVEGGRRVAAFNAARANALELAPSEV